MERNIQREAEITQPMPDTQIPAICFIPYKSHQLYVQMNIKSYVILPQKKLRLHQGFLFKVEFEGIPLTSITIKGDSAEIIDSLMQIEISQKSFPKITLINDGFFPVIFHPHFSIDSNFLNKNKGLWIDYRDKVLEADIASYVLRVARSLKYEKGYIEPNARAIGNHDALNWFLTKFDSGQFPTDHVQLPSAKTFKIVSDSNSIQPSMLPGSNIEDTNSLSNQVSTQSKPTQRKVKFEIQESQPPYSPIEQVQQDIPLFRDLDSNFRNEQWSSSNHEFYLRNKAFLAISQHIKWGGKTDKNVVEQGGILLGNVFCDPHSSIMYGVAEEAVAGELARGTPGYLEVTHETWKEMLDNVDRLNTDLQIIGWYHTHPNNLDVFMSGTDRATQSRLFGNDWQFAIVLNPHKRIWRAFYGVNSYECRGYVINHDSNFPSNENDYL